MVIFEHTVNVKQSGIEEIFEFIKIKCMSPHNEYNKKESSALYDNKC